jgi:uncharacterized protein YggE
MNRIILVGLALVVSLSAWRVDAAEGRPERYISVTGEGSVEAAPDLAVVQAGVTAQGKTAKTATDAASAAMTKVLAALKASGVDDKDIQTSNFSVHPQYDTRRDSDRRIVGFQASNQVSVKVRTLDRLPAVLDAVMGAGANTMSGIHFTVSEPSKLLDQARAEAVADARRKAELLAKAAGVGIGRATAIVEGGGQPVPYRRMAAAAAPAAPVPIAIGEQTLRVHVSVTFELLH